MNDSTLQIVLAIIGSGILTTLVSGGVTLIGKAMDKKNGVQASINELKQSTDGINKKLDEHIAQSYRNKILSFQNSCLRGERHSYEEFNEVIEAIQNYSDYVEKNNVKNEKCTLAIEYIRNIYKNCQNQSDFAPMSAQMIGDAELKKIIADVLAQQTKK